MSFVKINLCISMLIWPCLINFSLIELFFIMHAMDVLDINEYEHEIPSVQHLFHFEL